MKIVPVTGSRFEPVANKNSGFFFFTFIIPQYKSHLKTASGIELGHDANIWWINGGTNEMREVIMSDIKHLPMSKKF